MIRKNKSYFRLLLIPIFFIPLLIIVIFSIPYINSKITAYADLGFYSLIEERSSISKEYRLKRLLRGEKIQGKFKSSENNLGMVLVRFFNFNKINKDTVVFRIKEEGKIEWYYKNTYKVDQFLPDDYFTFGFPPIPNSRDRVYSFEIESLNGEVNDGISISSKKTDTAFAYQFSRPVLENNKNTLARFLYKKTVYALTNIDYPKVLLVVLLAYLFSLFLGLLSIFVYKKRKIIHKFISCLALKVVVIILNFFKNLHRFYLVPFLINFSKQPTFKNKSFIYLSIFVVFFSAFIMRLSFYLDKNNVYFPIWTTIGGFGDYDHLIRHANRFLANTDLTTFYWSLTNDYPSMVRILAFFWGKFGFIQGFDYFYYSFILASSALCLLPFLILSRFKKFSWGGFISSLLLAIHPSFIWLTVGRVIDINTLFFFSIFITLFILCLEKKNYYIAFLLAVVGFIDSFNRGLMIFNDWPALLLFGTYYLYDVSERRKKFPFFRLKMSNVFYAFFPFLVFTGFYIAYNIYFTQTFHDVWWFSPQELSTTFNPAVDVIEVLGVNSSLLEKLLNYFFLFISMLDQLAQYLYIPFVFLIATITLLFLTFKDLLIRKYRLFLLPAFIIPALLLIQQLFKFQNIINFNTKAYDSFISIGIISFIILFIFLELIILQIYILKKTFFRYSIIIFPYLIGLAYGLYITFTERHFVQVTLLLMIIFAIILDKMFEKLSIRKKPIITYLTMIYIISFLIFIISKTVASSMSIVSSFNYINKEKRYLIKAEKIIPKDGIILAGGEENLILISKYTKKSVLYNIFLLNPILITPSGYFRMPITDDRRPKHKVDDWLSTDFNSKNIFGDPKKFKKYKFYILDYDINRWIKYVDGGTIGYYTSIPAKNAGKFILKEVNRDSKGRSIYKLELKIEYNEII